MQNLSYRDPCSSADSATDGQHRARSCPRLEQCRGRSRSGGFAVRSTVADMAYEELSIKYVVGVGKDYRILALAVTRCYTLTGGKGMKDLRRF